MSRKLWDNYGDVRIAVVVTVICVLGAPLVARGAGLFYQTDLYAALSSIGQPFGLCQQGYHEDCVVDGDTIYYGGQLIRMVDYDIPEMGEPTCSPSLALRHKVTLRLLELLNSGPIAVRRVTDQDVDRYGRELRVVTIKGRSVRETLIAERLAQPRDRRLHFWCG